jgi:excisionase family DNA binding protein
MMPDPNETPRQWLTVAEVAREIHGGRRSVYRAIVSGRLRAARINSRKDIRVHRCWIAQWLESEADRLPPAA